MTESVPNQKPSILLCTPVRGGFSPSYVEATDKLRQWCRDEGIEFDRRTVAEAPVDAARNVLSDAYLAAVTETGHPYTHCLMIDSGVGYTVDTIKKLVAADVDYAAAAVPLRRIDRDAIVKRDNPNAGSTFAVVLPRDVRETGKVRLVNKGGAAFMEVVGIGAACICIKPKVLTRMFDAYPELRHKGGFAYFQPTIMTEDGDTYIERMRRLIKEARGHLQNDDHAHADGALAVALSVNHEDFEACGEDISFSRRWVRLHSDVRPAQIWLTADAPFVHEGHGYFQGNFSDWLT
jgi:hypothetical protein